MNALRDVQRERDNLTDSVDDLVEQASAEIAEDGL